MYEDSVHVHVMFRISFLGTALSGIDNVWIKRCPGHLFCPHSQSHCTLKSIRVHPSPGSSCGLVAYTCATAYFLYGTYSYLLTGRD